MQASSAISTIKRADHFLLRHRGWIFLCILFSLSMLLLLDREYYWGNRNHWSYSFFRFLFGADPTHTDWWHQVWPYLFGVHLGLAQILLSGMLSLMKPFPRLSSLRVRNLVVGVIGLFFTLYSFLWMLATIVNPETTGALMVRHSLPPLIATAAVLIGQTLLHKQRLKRKSARAATAS